MVFEKGLEAKGADTDLLRHVSANQIDTNFVATSRKIEIAEEFAGKNGFVFAIGSRRGVDVNATLGAKSPFPEQFEFAIPDGISNTEIIGAFSTSQGKISGDFIPNPNFLTK